MYISFWYRKSFYFYVHCSSNKPQNLLCRFVLSAYDLFQKLDLFETYGSPTVYSTVIHYDKSNMDVINAVETVKYIHNTFCGHGNTHMGHICSQKQDPLLFLLKVPSSTVWLFLPVGGVSFGLTILDWWAPKNGY